jgi:hypothetical protein
MNMCGRCSRMGVPVIDAIKYMASHGLVHYDLKLSNIFSAIGNTTRITLSNNLRQPTCSSSDELGTGNEDLRRPHCRGRNGLLGTL